MTLENANVIEFVKKVSKDGGVQKKQRRTVLSEHRRINNERSQDPEKPVDKGGDDALANAKTTCSISWKDDGEVFFGFCHKREVARNAWPMKLYSGMILSFQFPHNVGRK